MPFMRDIIYYYEISVDTVGDYIFRCLYRLRDGTPLQLSICNSIWPISTPNLFWHYCIAFLSRQYLFHAEKVSI